MADPKWFIKDYFLAQKADQMNHINWDGKSNWTAAEAGQKIDAFPTTAFENFTACNTSGYEGISAAQLNVAPNELFNVAEYVYNSAQYANMTMDAALNAMANTHHTSAWAHYTGRWDTEWLNPSNLFDTRAYVEDVAQAWNTISYHGKTDWNVNSVASAIKSAGMNPVMHYYEVGQDLGITPTVPTTLAKPAANWTPWTTGGSTPSDQTDPYDNVQTQVEITTDQDVYPAPGESYSGNTQFNAIWTGAYGASTLAANDIITGPAGALNTLAVELGRNWNGFNSKTDDDFNVIPNVTNIGRIKLDHIDSDSEADYSFDASGISNDVKQYDLNSTGAGTISVSNLNSGVEAINIRGVALKSDAKVGTTNLNWADTVDGKDDSLNIGLQNVGGPNTGLLISTDKNIENVTLNSEAGEQANYVDLSGMSGIKSLKVTGSNDINIYNSEGESIKAVDASAATGAVNFGASGLKGATTVIGGSGVDTVTLSSNVNITPAQWSSIEMLTMIEGGSVNAKNVEPGLSQLWTFGDGTTNTITNLSASDFSVTQGAAGEQTIKVDGNKSSLSNITYNFGTAGEDGATPTFSSNASNNATINVGAALLNGGTFTFSKAEGAVALNVNEDGWLGKNPTDNALNISAPNANSFTADIEGVYNYTAGDTITVANGKGSAGKLTFNLANGMTNSKAFDLATDGLVVQAKAASELAVNSGGDFVLNKDDSDLSGIKVATISVSGEGNGEDADGNALQAQFAAGDMTSAQKVTVTADDGAVTLGALGSAKGIADLTVNVDGASTAQFGAMNTSIGHNISLTVNASGDVTLDDFTATTNTNKNNQGDVKIVVTTDENVIGGNTVTADDILVDFSGVAGDITDGITLVASGSIRYTGATGADDVTVTAMSASQRSSFDLGEGADKISFEGISFAKGTARANIALGDDGESDIIAFNAVSGGGKLILNVTGFDGDGIDTLEGATAVTEDNFAALGKAFGVSFGSNSEVSNAADNTAGVDGILRGDTLYAFDADGAAATVMVVIHGVSAIDAE